MSSVSVGSVTLISLRSFEHAMFGIDIMISIAIIATIAHLTLPLSFNLTLPLPFHLILPLSSLLSPQAEAPVH